MVASGFLYHLGYFSFLPMLFALALGDLVADVFWYYLGYYFLEPFLKKRGHFFSVTPELLEKGKTLFHRYNDKILLISKVTLGFGMAIVTLMTAGASKVPFKRYMILNIIGEFILVTTLIILGYFFGQASKSIAGGFKIAFLVGVGIICVVALYGFSRYMKDKITKNIETK